MFIDEKIVKIYLNIFNVILLQILCFESKDSSAECVKISFKLFVRHPCDVKAWIHNFKIAENKNFRKVSPIFFPNVK